MCTPASCCILRAPPEGPQFSSLLNPTCSGGAGGLSSFNGCASGSSCCYSSISPTYIIPQFWTQNLSSFPEQAANIGLMQDDNWNSWTNDRIIPIPDNQRTTKNGPKVAGEYYVEYWYASKAQNPLAVNAGDYSIGDATADPQNIFNVWRDQAGAVGQDANSFSVAGFRNPFVIPSLRVNFLFKVYLYRFRYLIGSPDPALSEIKYGLCFLPIDTPNPTDPVSFYKTLPSEDYRMTRTGQNFTSSTAFNSFFAPAGINQAISDTQWEATDPSSEALNLVLYSTIEKFDQTAFSALVGTGETVHAHSFTLDPAMWLSNPQQAYGTVPIISPQAALEMHVTAITIANIKVVYRAVVRGWLILVGNETTPSLANTTVLRMPPKASPDGTGSYLADGCSVAGCDPSRITPISGTQSSTAGTNVITYQAVSHLNFWLLPFDADGNPVNPEIMNILPRTIESFVDVQPQYPYDSANPAYDMSYVFPDTGELIYTRTLGDLLLNGGNTRFSIDQGTTWSPLQNTADRDPYLSDTNYIGTGTPEKQPGSKVTLPAVTPDTRCCPDSPDIGPGLYNDYLEVIIGLNPST